MSEMVYAVHTKTCTYLLDRDGICRWVLSSSGEAIEDRCVGAQFVACLDLREEGGLLGELRVGASALFAQRERGRIALLKTSTIEHIDYLPPGGAAEAPSSAAQPVPRSEPPGQRPAAALEQMALTTQPLPSHFVAHLRGSSEEEPHAEGAPLSERRAHETVLLPEMGRSMALEADRHWPPEPSLIVPAPIAGPPEVGAGAAEDLTSTSEVTMTLPLYRPSPDDPPPRWAGGLTLLPPEEPSEGGKRRG